MIAWILGIALGASFFGHLIQWFIYHIVDDLRVEAIDTAKKQAGAWRASTARELRLEDINSDLQEELKRAGTHRDELMARYGDQEAERISSTEKAALRSERARKASQARWGKKEVA